MKLKPLNYSILILSVFCLPIFSLHALSNACLLFEKGLSLEKLFVSQLKSTKEIPTETILAPLQIYKEVIDKNFDWQNMNKEEQHCVYAAMNKMSEYSQFFMNKRPVKQVKSWISKAFKEDNEFLEKFADLVAFSNGYLGQGNLTYFRYLIFGSNYLNLWPGAHLTKEKNSNLFFKESDYARDQLRHLYYFTSSITMISVKEMKNCKLEAYYFYDKIIQLWEKYEKDLIKKPENCFYDYFQEEMNYVYFRYGYLLYSNYWAYLGCDKLGTHYSVWAKRLSVLYPQIELKVILIAIRDFLNSSIWTDSSIDGIYNKSLLFYDEFKYRFNKTT